MSLGPRLNCMPAISMSWDKVLSTSGSSCISQIQRIAFRVNSFCGMMVGTDGSFRLLCVA
mgnify:CR=1 FL=1